MYLRTKHILSEMRLTTFDEMLFHPGLLISFTLTNTFSNSSSLSSDPLISGPLHCI